MSFGTVVGLVTDAAKAPIGGATVTAIRAGGGIRSTISSSDGIYSFADVLPGSWSLTITVEGLPDVQVPALNVVAGKATRHDIAMNIARAHPSPRRPLAAPQRQLQPLLREYPKHSRHRIPPPKWTPKPHGPMLGTWAG